MPMMPIFRDMPLRTGSLSTLVGVFVVFMAAIAADAAPKPRPAKRAKTIKADDKAPTLSYDQFRRTVEVQVAEKREEQITGLLRLLELGAEVDEIPDIKFRLAELYYEKARFFFFRSQETLEKIVAAASEADTLSLQEEKGRYDEERERWVAEAMTMYREIREVYPGYARQPEVLFALAQAYWNQNQFKEAVDVYADLIRTYPESPLVSEAWLGFGEYYFNEGDVDKALQSYEKAAEDKRSRVYGFALYKQGWCHYNRADWETALDRFRGTVFYANLSTELSGENRIALGREAQRDFVRTYAHVGASERASAEFADLLTQNDCSSDACRSLLDQLADLPLLPGVFALIEVDGVLGLIEHLPDGPGTAVDGLDRIVGVVAHART
ncbi:MAG: tetratricopeptide repeat protein [Myxococcales bacterium]|nr:tetratricopeptide repeat protein [Myxococcales bacterium]